MHRSLANRDDSSSSVARIADRVGHGARMRIWFYRDMNPDELAGTPHVRLNGTPAGSAEPGAAFYGDVMPGHYHISADSYNQDAHNDRDVDLAPGTEAYARVLLLDNFIRAAAARSPVAIAAPTTSSGSTRPRRRGRRRRQLYSGQRVAGGAAALTGRKLSRLSTLSSSS